MASTLVQEVVGFLATVASTGSGTLTLPGVTEDVAGYKVTESVTISVTK